MFEDLTNESIDGDKIKIGRITFLVLSALAIGIFIRLFAFHAETKEEGFELMMFSFLSMALSLLLVVVGTIVVIWKATRRESFLFWLCSTIVVAIPGLYFGIMIIWIALTRR